jgi:long-chain-fatty-acid---luciferin-component ligase
VTAAARQRGVLHEATIDASTDVDALIASDGCFDLPLDQQRQARRALVLGAVRHHLSACPAYAAYATRMGFDVEDAFGRVDALERVPVVPSTAFKSARVLSVPEAEVAKWCLSSGTRGTQSRVGRDTRTLDRLLGTVRAGLALLESWHEDELEIVHLGPGQEDAGDVWFPYVMSLVELLYPTRSHVRGGLLDERGAVEHLVRALDRSPHVAVVGAPFLVLALVDAIDRRGLRVRGGGRVTVLTAGGWKRFADVAIPRAELDRRAIDALGLEGERQVRDAFNQVELNTVFIECSARRKHVPPWVYASTREPLRLAPQPPGTEGLLSYLDASAQSYPAMLVTDDVGVVDEGRCACGREGVTVTVSRRLERRASRGCALALAQGAGGDR